MRIAVSGTHFIGKSTLIEDFVQKYPHYQHIAEPYYLLQYEQSMDLALEPDFDNLVEQLDCSINAIDQFSNEQAILFDRCPIDFIAYATCICKQDELDLMDTKVSEKFDEVRQALTELDLIVFLPISSDNLIEYSEENPGFRIEADNYFKKIYHDDLYGLFPNYNQPKIVEITGNRTQRVKILESIVNSDSETLS